METSLASLFKAYDIRGLAPEQINAAFAKRLGKTIAAHLEPKTVVVGRDMRITSSALESALIEGLTSSGVNVVRIGLCSTPLFNITIGLANGAYDLGVMITASHNPGKFNGFKITKSDCLPIGEGSGMEELRDAFLAERVVESDHVGSVTDDPTACDKYIDHILSLAQLPADMPKMKIAIDAGNGMAGAILPRLFTKLPWLDVVPLYFEPDGTFPNHEANPLKVETLVELKRRVVQDGCVAGAAFDGDADRVGFVDEKGEELSGDLLTAFFAEEMLLATGASGTRSQPSGQTPAPGSSDPAHASKSLIHYDVRSSWTVPEVVEAAGGRAEMSQVGHAKIKRLMAQTGAIFGGETSMHFYFKSLWNCESGDLAMLLLLKELFRKAKPLSELWAPLKRYVHSGEKNFEVEDPKAVVKLLKEKYASQASSSSEIDGIRLEFRANAGPENGGRGNPAPTDWWFNVRASNTEPLLRLNVEARSPQVLAERVRELSLLIRA